MADVPPNQNQAPAEQPPAGEGEEGPLYLGDEAAEDNDDEAFIDLDDPENQVEEIDAPPAGSGAGADGQAQPEDEEEEEPQGEFPVAKEPVRDDAVFTWAAAENQPLHTVAAHPSKPSIVAVGGEAEHITVLDVSRRAGASSSPAIFDKHAHTDTITQLTFSPDGAMLASGSMDCTVKLWDTTTYSLLHTLEDLAGEVEFLLWHPSSKVLLGGGADAQCLLWNVAKGAVAQYFVGHRGPVTCGAWAMDVKKVLTGSNDGTLMLFNPKTGECDAAISKDLSTVKAGVTCVAAANKAADLFVAGCEDGSLHVVSAAKSKVMKSLDDIHEQAVEAISFSDLSGNVGLFATCSCDCKVVVWASHDFTVRSVTRCGEGVTRLLWANELLIAGCTDGDTRVWDGRVAAGEPRTALMGHRQLVLGLALAADGSHVFSVADDGTAKAFVKARYTLDEPSIAQAAVKEATEKAHALGGIPPPQAAAADDDEEA
uniref:Guanine nucleotide-binding protein subunit beta-like protein n=1 Tax=Neobodo designis TaxID=312471 RepID=A0A7S1LKT8_NEODS|mmetsp:Transcript_2420/g.7533  ORF Transcript_2420/g.7533 Transcript_2420/m.7533 type:complete len:484 (+) Transcript_2420:32-1483(+)|eukprot:CAMPEP_0174828390 /NCGR_PEP_ID=MMETSP1114-20130205/1300_1 /TAXON_ID=312471 /ORGANISM="Neobodo designis, Strain CCAP 1951/1" /LENGTH=483 /DNA_ID=CAMNT_0016062103 /DNA_START=39 /DNA_END=1490 /DNA_ORIENTATION=+